MESAELWTLEAVVDELIYALAGAKMEIRHADRILTVKKYYAQARKLIPLIPVANPPPDFITYLSDIPDNTKTQLANIGELEDQRYVLRQAAGQIFENLDFELYHRSIARKLNVVVRP